MPTAAVFECQVIAHGAEFVAQLHSVASLHEIMHSPSDAPPSAGMRVVAA